MIRNTGSPFGPLITPMATPFQDDFSLDLKAAERIVNHLIASGTETIIVNGTTGESPTIEESEFKILFRCVKEKANGKAKVMAGAGANSTAKTIKLSQIAQESGAEGLLIVTPYYNKPSQAGLVKHYQEVAKNVDLPIMLYNVPGRTSVNLGVEATLEIVESCINVMALKDSTGSTDQIAEISSKVQKNNFWVYSGDDYLTLPSLSVGATGIVSVAAHLIGRSIKKMIECYFQGKYDEARKIHYQCLPLFKGLFAAPSPTCLKYALERTGLCKGVLRLPLIPLNADEKKKLEAIMDKSPIDVPQPALSV
jgi:4-hydroxy-tetrahydrodipicolinate synthase